MRDRVSPRSCLFVTPAKAGAQRLSPLILHCRQFARLPRASGPLPRPGSLSLACPRESNQRERHPAWRCLGCAQPVREGRPGFSTGLLPGRKVPDVLSGTPAGPDRPPLTTTQGIGESSCRCAAHRNDKATRPLWERTQCATAEVIDTPRSRTRCAPTGKRFCSWLWPVAFPPLCHEQAGGGSARRVAGRTPARGSSGQDALSIHPASRLRPRRGAASGWPFSWLLLFTPGILPSALRAGFAVRTRSCACVATQREVTRCPAWQRKPATGEPSHDGIRKSENHWIPREARPFGTALRVFCTLRACPAAAGMTNNEDRGKKRSRTGCAPTRGPALQ